MDILIIEEETLAYTGFEMIIHGMYPKAKVSRSSDIPERFPVDARPRPDFIIIDIDASKKMGMSNVKKLKKLFQQVPLLVISNHEEQVFAVSYIRAGANGFISKRASVDEFQKAFETILAGRRYLSKPVWEMIVQNASEGKNQVVDLFKILSAREKKVLKLMIDGKSAREIATLLNIREVTVKKHQAQLRDKLNVENLKDVIKKAAWFH